MSRPVRVLLVDDEISIQRTMVPLLRSRGYEVTVAGTARDALAEVENERPDLIVLDLGLPDMDGLDVCRRVRARWDTPIVVLSARGAEKDKVAALDEGADDYVTKPFGPDELLARVRAALRRASGGELSRQIRHVGRHVPKRGTWLAPSWRWRRSPPRTRCGSASAIRLSSDSRTC